MSSRKDPPLSVTHRFTVEVYDSREFCLNPPELLTRDEARAWLESIAYEADKHRNQSINVMPDTEETA